MPSNWKPKNQEKIIPSVSGRGTTASPARYNSGAFHSRPMTHQLKNLSQDIIPEHVKRDPALGSPVPFSLATDSMGFLIFLGLATVLLP